MSKTKTTKPAAKKATAKKATAKKATAKKGAAPATTTATTRARDVVSKHDDAGDDKRGGRGVDLRKLQKQRRAIATAQGTG